MKTILAMLVCLSLASTGFTQSIKKFDKKKFNDFKFQHDFDDLNSLNIKLDTSTFALAPENDILVYVPQSRMALMPNMKIRKDIDYTILIKKFNSNYPYSTTEDNANKLDGFQEEDSIPYNKQ